MQIDPNPTNIPCRPGSYISNNTVRQYALPRPVCFMHALSSTPHDYHGQHAPGGGNSIRDQTSFPAQRPFREIRPGRLLKPVGFQLKGQGGTVFVRRGIVENSAFDPMSRDFFFICFYYPNQHWDRLERDWTGLGATDLEFIEFFFLHLC